MYAYAAACNAGAAPRHRGGITCNPQLSPTDIAIKSIGGVLAQSTILSHCARVDKIVLVFPSSRSIMFCELPINLSVLINPGFDKQVIDTSFDFVVTINYNARSQTPGPSGSNHPPAPVHRVGHDLCTKYAPCPITPF